MPTAAIFSIFACLGLSLVKAPLHGGDNRFGVDQPDLDLVIDRLAICPLFAPLPASRTPADDFAPSAWSCAIAAGQLSHPDVPR